MSTKLTKSQRDVLRRITEGWRPFPIQHPALIKLGLMGYVRFEYDERNRLVAEPTRKGVAALTEVGKP